MGRPRAWLQVTLVAILVLACSGTGMAAPVDASHAQKAVRGWLRHSPQPLAARLGTAVGRVESFMDDQGQPLYYVIHLDPSGMVIVPADDEVEPIICFLEGDTYDPSAENPLALLVKNDLSGRIAAARDAAAGQLLSGTTGPDAQAADRPRGPAENKAKWQQLDDQADAATMLEAAPTSISDVRVAPLVQSKWSQGSYGSTYLFNYYTPNHDVCGCVATALAQILRYWQYPTAGIGSHGFTVQVDGASQTMYTRGGDGAGGPYDWSQMVLVPGSAITTTQRQAIGALCADAGAAVNMSYTANASGASGTAAKTALVSTFGYANAIRTGYSTYSGAPLYNILNSNLDAGLPCMLAITDGSSGHAVVADGYGYDTSTPYHHINLGWSGSYDAWYNLPTINTAYNFNAINAVIYNIYVTGTGEIISGRITDQAGAPLSGVTVTAQRTTGGTYTATTNAKGIYALAKVPGSSTYTVAPAASGYAFTSQNVATGTSTDGRTTAGNCWGINFTSTLLIPGDIDGDGHVTLADIKLLIAAWNTTPASGSQWNPAADIDGSGSVTLSDLKILVSNWGQ